MVEDKYNYTDIFNIKYINRNDIDIYKIISNLFSSNTKRKLYDR